MSNRSVRAAGALVGLLSALSAGCAKPARIAAYPEGPGTALKSRGLDDARLSPKLQSLVQEFSVARNAGRPGVYSDSQLRTLFGVDPKAADPAVAVVIELKEGQDAAAVSKAGATIHAQFGQTVYGAARVRDLERLALDPAVARVSHVSPALVPPPPAPSEPGKARGPSSERGEGDFDRMGLTGKGVIVAIIDTGIDWRHPDFIRPDGESRIAYLYDLTDDSYAESGGKIGAKPPRKSVSGKPIGTLYTRSQITAALRGTGKVNSTDSHGHGTACAGMAAGNGRATGNGVPAGKYVGVAPEADLVVVRASSDGDYENNPLIIAAGWIPEVAKELGKPCVVSMSLGGHHSAHDGTEETELLLDRCTEKGAKPGLVACVAAGNEGQHTLHAAGRFGPRRENQLDVDGTNVELFVAERTVVDAYFTATDHWGLGIAGLNGTPLNKPDRAQHLYIYTDGKEILYGRNRNLPQSDLEEFKQRRVSYDLTKGNEDNISVVLDPGRYVLWGFGKDAEVKDGRFSLYLPAYAKASFGKGAISKEMVGSPGNSTSAITVGSYDFRGSWRNRENKWTGVNLKLGDISAYSSPGYRRDNVVKPDITGPGCYAISSLAAGSEMSKMAKNVVDSGRHIAWKGTSASTPYVAGVVALMLEKNPQLTANKVREILAKTAMKADSLTGALPNIQWGNGKIDPQAAIAATPRP